MDRKRYRMAAARPNKTTGLRTAPAPITTLGSLRNAHEAWVYVGVSAKGRVKVGMSADPARRCASMHIRLHHASQVVPAAAKAVETEALRLLGNRKHEGEWGLYPPEEAVAAVRQAFHIVGLSRRVDPSLSDEADRQRRILLAIERDGPYLPPKVDLRAQIAAGGCMAESALLVWNVASVEPGQHALASQEARQAGFQIIDPKIREALRLPQGKRGVVVRPLWPGYMLIGRAPDMDYSALYRCRGVVGLLSLIGDRYTPAVVRQDLVDWLLANMSAMGIVEPVSAPDIAPALPAIPVNSPIRILAGALAGHEGVVEVNKDQRVIVLLNLLGRNVRTTLKRHQVEEA